jgi:hypothetical protein
MSGPAEDKEVHIKDVLKQINALKLAECELGLDV